MSMKARTDPDPVDVAVGARIRMRRKSLGVTQSNLADALGLTFQQVQKYERGTNRISASMLVRTARKLECNVSDLFGEAPGGGSVQDATLLQALAEPYAIDALMAFNRIADTNARHAVLTLMRQLDGVVTRDRTAA